MTVSRLLKSFSQRHHAPVEVSDVLAALREHGVEDKIVFFRDLDLDPGTLHGFLVRVELSGGEPVKRQYESTITYGKLGHERERLISCKELIHILDPKAHRVATEEQIKHLVSKIVLPPELQDPFSDGEEVSNDRLALMEALAVLFPLNARNVIYAKFIEKKITIPQIAERLELPQEYVATVMNGYWPDFVRGLISYRERIEEARKSSSRPRKSRDTTVPARR